MAHAHLAFDLDGFEDSEETVAETVNGVHGKALAVHVARALAMRGYEVSDIWPEDHGWDFSARKQDRSYLLACCVAPSGSERPAGARNEAHITWSRARSFLDALRGRNRLTSEDESVVDLRAIAVGLGAAGETVPDIR